MDLIFPDNTSILKKDSNTCNFNNMNKHRKKRKYVILNKKVSNF